MSWLESLCLLRKQHENLGDLWVIYGTIFHPNIPNWRHVASDVATGEKWKGKICKLWIREERDQKGSFRMKFTSMFNSPNPRIYYLIPLKLLSNYCMPSKEIWKLILHLGEGMHLLGLCSWGGGGKLSPKDPQRRVGAVSVFPPMEVNSLSDLLHSVWQTLGPSTSFQMTQFHFFS